MHLPLISDMHGNPLALDAVLADIAAQGGVDETWVLGDLAALGYDSWLDGLGRTMYTGQPVAAYDE